MQTIVDDLAQSLIRVSNKKDKRVLVGLCGTPGSGKSQLAKHVVERINAVHNDQQIAVVVGMDGWHLTRAQLAQMPDPQLAKDKRGAAWTFDDQAFAAFVEDLHNSDSSKTIFAPSFSHTKKDPSPNDIAVHPSHRIVIIEGLYANVDEGAWSKAAALYDERWVIECPEPLARARLIERHVVTGVAQSKEEAEWRADNNDLPNGRYLLSHVKQPAKRILSTDDKDWRGEE
ncbi:P-loop containing nucleoside triphosphate hydrolase protein [Meira miltonrushii]|uniref:P-loop containing nucleoside triphosphate hydrolase protein n=1 Tax=Meira miltonrushii TaxID=1280837 RepID=A0A316VG42_9BASI|nr:P-loop containing nucleoside triphosphate hydrolase protein [Meira miltonrushii]PWN36496.1 P-loop containing nucleoside triphosphate hydrolase protein [Meira miltonrushii]